MRRCTLVALLLLIALPCAAQDTQRITIAAYNLENAFDVFDDPYTEDEGTDVKQRWELQAIADAIAAMDADIVVFSELENEPLLRALVQEKLPDAGYDHVAVTKTNDPRGINLGLISRLPIDSVTSHRLQTLTHPDAPGRTWQFARDLLRAEVRLNDQGETLLVYAVHLKSNSDSPDDPNSRLWRTAEAMRIKQIVRAEVAADPDVLAVVAGDFNSAYETRPEQPRPWPAMAHLLQTEPEGAPLLTDVHAALTDEQRVTLPGDGRYPPVTFDYLLATPALAEAYIDGSADILRDARLTSGSDHLPVYASFELPR